jgi:antitoxin component of MazEF toxin-antitoxin module
MNNEISLEADGSLILPAALLAPLRIRPGQKVKVSVGDDGQIILSACVAPGAQLLRGMLGRKLAE